MRAVEKRVFLLVTIGVTLINFGVFLGLNIIEDIITVYKMGEILTIIVQDSNLHNQLSIQLLSESDLNLIEVLLNKYSVFTFEELKLIINYCKLYNIKSIRKVILNNDFQTVSEQIIQQKFEDFNVDALLFVISVLMFL